MNQSKILFVDDDEFIRKIYTDRLEASGFAVTTAKSVDQSKKILDTENFDLICLDYKLGTQSGLDLLRWIRIDKIITAPVIIFSASGQEAQMKEFLEAGANEYIQKDHVVPTQLVERIKSLIQTTKHE